MWYGLLPCLEEMPLPTKYILKASPLREVNITKRTLPNTTQTVVRAFISMTRQPECATAP